MENLNQNSTPTPAVASTTKPPGEVNRPWQGTLLGILNIVGLVGLAILTIGAFIGGSLLSSLFAGFALLSGLGMAIGFIFMALWILVFFITRGIFKGAKWAVIVSIVFTVLGIIPAIMNISEMFLTLVIYAGMLYLEVFCLKDPYYNNN